jgi:hypothetical protein
MQIIQIDSPSTIEDHRNYGVLILERSRDNGPRDLCVVHVQRRSDFELFAPVNSRTPLLKGYWTRRVGHRPPSVGQSMYNIAFYCASYG